MKDFTSNGGDAKKLPQNDEKYCCFSLLKKTGKRGTAKIKRAALVPPAPGASKPPAAQELAHVENRNLELSVFQGQGPRGTG